MIRVIQRGIALRLALVLTCVASGAAAQYSRATAQSACSKPTIGWHRLTSPPFFHQPVAPATPAHDAITLDNIVTSYIVLPSQPSTIIATDGSAIARSADGGCTWTTVFSVSGAITGLHVDPYSPQSVLPYYIASLLQDGRAPGGRVAYAMLATGDSPQSASAFTSAPPLLVAVTTDGGASWRLKLPSPSAGGTLPHCLSLIWAEASPVTSGVIGAACSVGVADSVISDRAGNGSAYIGYRSEDAGLTWQEFWLPPAWELRAGLAFDAREPHGLWAVTDIIDGGTVHWAVAHSKDAKTWQQLPSPISTPRLSLDAHEGIGDRPGPTPTTTQLTMWAGGDGAFVSIDDAKHWQQVRKPIDGGAFIRGTAGAITGVAWLTSGDVELTEQYAATSDCPDQHAALVRLHARTWRPVAMPPPWVSSEQIATAWMPVVADARPPTTYALVTTKPSCGAPFLASYTSAR